jgi:N-acetylneuraminic acid mutarotase
MRRRWFGLPLCLLCFDMNAESIRISWEKSTPMPEPRSSYAAGVLDGKMVFAGGNYWEGTKGHWTQKIFTDAVHVFDPEDAQWRKLPNMPTPLGCAASVVIGQRLFVLGGYTGQQVSTNIYTLEKAAGTYTWKTFGPMPADRLFSGAVAVGTSIFLLGGTEQFEPYDKSGTCCTSRSAVKTLLALDTAAPGAQWRARAPFPGSPRWLFALETDGESLWMFGGAYQENASDPITRIPEVWRYRIAGDRWELVGAVPTAAIEGSPLVPFRYGGSIFLVSFKKTVWRFDCSTFTWSQSTPLPEEAFVDRFYLVGNQIVGSGGENKLDAPRRRSDWTFIGRIESDPAGKPAAK